MSANWKKKTIPEITHVVMSNLLSFPLLAYGKCGFPVMMCERTNAAIAVEQSHRIQFVFTGSTFLFTRDVIWSQNIVIFCTSYLHTKIKIITKHTSCCDPEKKSEDCWIETRYPML